MKRIEDSLKWVTTTGASTVNQEWLNSIGKPGFVERADEFPT